MKNPVQNKYEKKKKKKWTTKSVNIRWWEGGGGKLELILGEKGKEGIDEPALRDVTARLPMFGDAFTIELNSTSWEAPASNVKHTAKILNM